MYSKRTAKEKSNQWDCSCHKIFRLNQIILRQISSCCWWNQNIFGKNRKGGAGRQWKIIYHNFLKKSGRGESEDQRPHILQKTICAQIGRTKTMFLLLSLFIFFSQNSFPFHIYQIKFMQEIWSKSSKQQCDIPSRKVETSACNLPYRSHTIIPD